MNAELAALILAWVMILLLSLAMAGLMRQVHLLAHPGQHALNVSRLAPGSRSEELTAAIGELSKPSVILFLDSSCRACGWVLPAAGRQADSHSDLGFVAAYKAKANGEGDGRVRVLENQGTVFEMLGISVTPLAAYVSRTGMVVNVDVLGSPEMLRGFIDRAEERSGLR